MNSIALIFDHDGTLVDSESLHFECWRQVMNEYDVLITEAEYINDHNGIPTLQNADVFIQQYQLDVDAKSLARRKQSLFKQRSLAAPPELMPTVLETLILAAAQGFRTGIATGAGTGDLARSVFAHGFTDYIEVMATRSDVAQGKPAPDVYLLACSRLGVEPSKAYAFEDTAAGIASAKAAGMYCIAIPNAYSRLQDLSEADAECDSLMAAYQHVLEGV
jgi:HAD superfamily hydrolase (TIGR01509 family)